MAELHPASCLGLLRESRAGDPNAAPRCGAKGRQGAACRAPAMSSGGAGALSEGELEAPVFERCLCRTAKHALTQRVRKVPGTACAGKRSFSDVQPGVEPLSEVSDLCHKMSRKRRSPGGAIIQSPMDVATPALLWCKHVE
jgi:hypothetical protein